MSTEAWLAMKNNIANHELTVLHDDGLYRHLRMSAGNSIAFSWDVITWPGGLAIRGDIGHELVFTRPKTDMLDFFRDPDHDDTVADGGTPHINPDYWAEKTRAAGLKTFELEPAMAEVAEHMVNTLTWGASCNDWSESLAACCALVEAWEDFRSACRIGYGDEERAIVSWLMDNPDVGDHDAWEWDLRVWDYHYLLTCYAIVTTVAAWDRRGPANYPSEAAYLEYGVGYREVSGALRGVISYDTATAAAGVVEENRRAGDADSDFVAAVRRIGSWRPVSDTELAQAIADEDEG